MLIGLILQKSIALARKAHLISTKYKENKIIGKESKSMTFTFRVDTKEITQGKYKADKSILYMQQLKGKRSKKTAIQIRYNLIFSGKSNTISSFGRCEWEAIIKMTKVQTGYGCSSKQPCESNQQAIKPI